MLFMKTVSTVGIVSFGVYNSVVSFFKENQMLNTVQKYINAIAVGLSAIGGFVVIAMTVNFINAGTLDDIFLTRYIDTPRQFLVQKLMSPQERGRIAMMKLENEELKVEVAKLKEDLKLAMVPEKNLSELYTNRISEPVSNAVKAVGTAAGNSWQYVVSKYNQAVAYVKE